MITEVPSVLRSRSCRQYMYVYEFLTIQNHHQNFVFVNLNHGINFLMFVVMLWIMVNEDYQVCVRKTVMKWCTGVGIRIAPRSMNDKTFMYLGANYKLLC